MTGPAKCPRCQHANETRARFCANCGLNLSAAARPVAASNAGKGSCCSGTWLVVLIVGGALLLAGVAGVFRVRHPSPTVVPARTQRTIIVDHPDSHSEFNSQRSDNGSRSYSYQYRSSRRTRDRDDD